MCISALAIAQVAVSAGSAVAEFGAAQADFNAQMQAYNQNVVNAYAAARDEQKQLTQRQLQEQDATHQKLHLSYIEEAEKKAEAEVSAEAAGVSGISVDNLIADVGRRSGYNRQAARENYRYTAAQLQIEQDATITRAKTRIDSVPLPSAPSPWPIFFKATGTGLKIKASEM